LVCGKKNTTVYWQPAHSALSFSQAFLEDYYGLMERGREGGGLNNPSSSSSSSFNL